MEWKQIAPEAFEAGAFTIFHKDWALLAAGTAGSANAMTVSWGGLGTFFSRPMATVYVREDRYTYGFLEAADSFSLSFFSEEMRPTLSYLGTVSGRDEDKIAKSGLTLLDEGGMPVFAQAEKVILCRKFYSQTMSRASFADGGVPEKFYGAVTAIHKVYMGQVEKILVRG